MANITRRLGRRGLVIGATLALAATAAVAVSLQPNHQANAAVTPAALGPLVWADDFNGPAGSAPDASKWGHETGGSGFGNNELEYYTTSTSNASLDGNGDLVITARREDPAGYGCWYRACTDTSAPLENAR